MKIALRDTLRQLKLAAKRVHNRLVVPARFSPPKALTDAICTRQSAGPEILRLPVEFTSRSKVYHKTGIASFGSEEVYLFSHPSEITVHEAKFACLNKHQYLDVGLQSRETWSILRKPFEPKPTKQHTKLLVPWGHGAASYGDFIIKVLPKVSRLLDAVPTNEHKEIGLCMPYFTRHQWAIDYLERLGLDRSQIFDESSTVLIPAHGTLIVGSGPAVGHGIAHPQDLRNLIRKLTQGLPAVSNKPWRRLYISRKTGRRMANEIEILEGLVERSFEILHLEDLTLEEQISRFREAALIVGPHGAGHANIIWCSPETCLFEVFHPSWMHPCYALLSQILGLRYHCLVGRTDRSHGAWTEKSRYGIFEDPAVEPANFFRALDLIIRDLPDIESSNDSLGKVATSSQAPQITHE